MAGRTLHDAGPVAQAADVGENVSTDLLAELQRARADKAEAEALYQNLTDQLPVSIYRKDLEGRFVFANRVFCQTLGRSLADIIGRTDYDFSPPGLADKYVEDDRGVIASGQVFRGVEQHLDRDGEPTFIQIFKFPVRNAAGRIVGTQGFWMDVTPLKRAEAALTRRTEDLEAALKALRENTQKLLVAEKMASLGRLTAGIAHEMNTPLAAVRSALADLERLVGEYAESAVDPGVTSADHQEIAADMRERLRLARSAAERTVGFVRGIKAQTRGMGAAERRSFDAVAIAREALVLLGHELRRSNAKLSFDAQPACITMDANPGRLAQVVTNLVSNALDAVRDQGERGRIDVRLCESTDAVLFTVRDNGCGIGPENLSRIFDPMFTTKPFGEGTGLGLTIVHDIVTADLGGDIEVDSQQGQGTTFTVRLPRPAPLVSSREEHHGPQE